MENLYLSNLKGLIDVYMLKHMFTNWKMVLVEEKWFYRVYYTTGISSVTIFYFPTSSFLHTLGTSCLCCVWCRFPNPLGYVVKEELFFSHMGKILQSKHADIVKEIMNNYKKPSWCMKVLWEEEKA